MTKVSDFFKNDYVDQASYDNLRKIASLVDGQKNSSRKVLYTILEKNIRQEIKVSQLGSKVSEFSEYLHGTLDGVIVNLAQDFVGTNNIPLLFPEGTFGTRFAQEASAPRYIYTYGTDEFFDLFKKEDSPILKHQYFEGAKIEPMYYVPTLPILLVNGSEGVSSGFAQKILPRSPDVIKKYITEYLAGKVKPATKKALVPHYHGYTGTIEQGDTSAQWLIKGVAKQVGVNKVLITEVPIGYNLRSYINVLDELEDKKLIQSYRDKSENDKFEFEVTIHSKLLKQWSNDTLLTKLKLVKKVSENYTAMSQHNTIVMFDSAEEILQAYIDVKLASLALRKQHLIDALADDIQLNSSKYTFIKKIVDDELVVNKRKKAEIVADLDGIKNIEQRDGSYDYLLTMNILSLTKERLDKLKSEITRKKSELKALKLLSESQLWLNDL